jgi:uncharacterized membrane protein
MQALMGHLSVAQAAVLLGCGAAFFWGGGDFFGGLGVRLAGSTMRASLQLILVSHVVSLLVVLGLIGGLHGGLPHGAALAWGVGAGICAGLGLMCFYVAISTGTMGPAASVSGLLCAGIPAVLGMLTQGSPGLLRGAGFVAAATAIWLIAAGHPGDKAEHRVMLLSVVSGVAFGLFFIGLKMANGAGPLGAMCASRVGSVSATLIALAAVSGFGRKASGATGASVWSKAVMGCALATVVMDTAGNMLYIGSTRLGRLDVAAVLASLYPVSTILLAAWLLHEHPSARQRWGMALALAAVVMITI